MILIQYWGIVSYMAGRKAIKKKNSTRGNVKNTSSPPSLKVRYARISQLFTSQENLTNILILIFILYFLTVYLNPSLLFLETTTQGGDLLSHYYPAKYLHDYLIPHGQLKGWSPYWYGGYPILEFYMPLPFIIVALLGYILPISVAFKIVSSLGIFLLPITTLISMKILGFRFPTPIIGAIFSLVFLFFEDNLMYGGSIASTLAGEFCYSIGFSIMPIYISLLYTGIRSGRFHPFLPVLLAIIILTHLFVAIYLAVISVFMLMISWKAIRPNTLLLLKLGFLAFLLTSFWTIPLIYKLSYTIPNNFEFTNRSISLIFARIFQPYLPFALIGVYLALRERNWGGISLVLGMLASITLFFLSPVVGIHLSAPRFVPQLYYLTLLLAAYGISGIIRWINRTKERIPLAIFPLILLLLTASWVDDNTKFVDQWFTYNYSGYERNKQWTNLKALADNISSDDSFARVAYEHHPKQERLGGIRTFEILPVFADKPVLEGLAFEHGMSSPYIFYIQSEISDLPANPIHGRRYGTFNIDDGTKHLLLFNTKYLIASSEKLKSSLIRRNDYEFIGSYGEVMDLYELKTNTGRYVELLDYEPILVKTSDWGQLSYDWFMDLDALDTHLVFEKEIDDEDEQKFHLITNESDLRGLQNIPKIPISDDCSVEESVFNEKIEISTDCIGKPLLIKMTYFPNWQVHGAKKIYLISPSFMLIFPEQSTVTLTYSFIWVDHLGYLLTLIGLFLVVSIYRNTPQ